MAMKGRCLRAEYNSSMSQLQSQIQQNQSSTFPNINGRGYNRETVNKSSDNNTRCNRVVLSKKRCDTTRLPAIVSSHTLKVKSKKVTKESKACDTFVFFENQGKHRKSISREEKQHASKTIVQVQLGVKAKGTIITGLPVHKRSKSVPETYVNNGPLWEVQNSRVHLEGKTNDQASLLRGKKFVKESSRKCSCGLSEPKYCMLHLMEVVHNFRKPRHRQVAWVPMSLCTTYV